MKLANDVARCSGDGCFLRENCKRFLAEKVNAVVPHIAPAVTAGQIGHQCENQLPLCPPCNEDCNQGRNCPARKTK